MTTKPMREEQDRCVYQTLACDSCAMEKYLEAVPLVPSVKGLALRLGNLERHVKAGTGRSSGRGLVWTDVTELNVVCVCIAIDAMLLQQCSCKKIMFPVC